MMNKRDLKKSINYICSELFAECVAVSLYEGNAKTEDVDAVLASIVHTHCHYIRRISHIEPGMKAKAYYKDLIEHFNKEVDNIIDHIRNLIG
jgi:hypothetical protein